MTLLEGVSTDILSNVCLRFLRHRRSLRLGHDENRTVRLTGCVTVDTHT